MSHKGIKMKEKSFKRKKELIEAALDEFTTNRYENASLNKIIKNAGISKGTFYYHFQDKQAIYIFLLKTAYEKEWEYINKRVKERAIDFEGKDFFEKFKLQSQIGMEFGIAYPKYMKLATMFRKEEENDEMHRIFQYVNSARENTAETWLVKMITHGIEDGDFNNRFPKDFIMKIMKCLFIHFDEMFDVGEDYEKGKLLEDINDLIDFLKYGFGKSSSKKII